MSLTSALLSIATGALRGRKEGQDQARREAIENLDVLDRLAQNGAFSVLVDSHVPEGGALPQPPGPHPRDVPGSDQSNIPPILRGARSVLSAARETGQVPGAVPAAADNTAGARAIKVGRLRIGGQDVTIGFDPNETPAAQQRQQQAQLAARRRASYERLNRQDPGSLGDFDPTFDYEGLERQRLEQKGLEQALIAAGYSPEDARVLARYNIDLDQRRQKREAARLWKTEAEQRMAEFRSRQQDARVARLAEEATGLLGSGADPNTLGATLYVLHPDASVADITRAVGLARSQSTLRNATVAQKTQSGQPKGRTVKVFGQEINLDEPASADATQTGKTAPKGDAPDAVLDELIEKYGDDDEAIRRELRRRGYNDQ
jgi:hypothetical protein